MGLMFRSGHRHHRQELALAALTRVGLADRTQHRPQQLSGGEQQRVAVARAVIHQPSLLLADEPTGNLDRKNAHQLLALLQELCKAMNTTVIMVTHDEELSHQYADRRIHLLDGQVTMG